MARKKPIGLIVRRGASHRFDALARKTADLPVEVSWDRRTENRRASPESVPVERRSSDRRKAPPFTWETADFVVVDAAHDFDNAYADLQLALTARPTFIFVDDSDDENGAKPAIEQFLSQDINGLIDYTVHIDYAGGGLVIKLKSEATAMQ